MDQVLQKKINMLVHLANADGHFDVKERAFIKDLLAGKGIDHKKLDTLETTDLKNVHTIIDKEQALYWALQLAKADGKIHVDELAFCKAVAFRLRFLPEVIDEFLNNDLPEFSEFLKVISPYRTFSVRE